MVQKLLNLKQQILKLWAYPFGLGNISENWSVDNIKKTGLQVYVYGFSVDYDAIAVSDILDIDKYLIKKKKKCIKNVSICEANICFSNDVFWL